MADAKFGYLGYATSSGDLYRCPADKSHAVVNVSICPGTAYSSTTNNNASSAQPYVMLGGARILAPKSGFDPINFTGNVSYILSNSVTVIVKSGQLLSFNAGAGGGTGIWNATAQGYEVD